MQNTADIMSGTQAVSVRFGLFNGFSEKKIRAELVIQLRHGHDILGTGAISTKVTGTGQITESSR